MRLTSSSPSQHVSATTLKPRFLSVCTGSGSSFVLVISIIRSTQQGLCLRSSCTACSMYYIQIFQKTSVCPALHLRLFVTLLALRSATKWGWPLKVFSSWQCCPNRHRCYSTTCPTNEIEIPAPTTQAPAVLHVSRNDLLTMSRAPSHHQFPISHCVASSSAVLFLLFVFILFISN